MRLAATINIGRHAEGLTTPLLARFGKRRMQGFLVEGSKFHHLAGQRVEEHLSRLSGHHEQLGGIFCTEIGEHLTKLLQHRNLISVGQSMDIGDSEYVVTARMSLGANKSVEDELDLFQGGLGRAEQDFGGLRNASSSCVDGQHDLNNGLGGFGASYEHRQSFFSHQRLLIDRNQHISTVLGVPSRRTDGAKVCQYSSFWGLPFALLP
mmetsp:Transcript_8006/g.12450  ORF Transcript_8006/g.12450 Transcript_8006/m.12450 type:complete len:208 (-) Transcript_8006:5428-6051(-)